MELHKIYTGVELNAFGEKFYKIVNSQKLGYRGAYKHGLNIDTNVINLSDNNPCDGFATATINDIFMYADNCPYFCKVIIPDDALCYVGHRIIKTNKIIIISFSRFIPPELYDFAVKQNGWALQYVKNQTLELCTMAVKQNGWALQYVKIEQTPELCALAVTQEGFTLQYVKNQTPELCALAVKQDGRALRYVEDLN